ncbi:MAG: DNA alkylation repair protein [Candidatus Nanopelagicales bacterium]
MTTDWSGQVAEVRTILTPLADPVLAPAIAGYMKNVAPFLGMKMPVRRQAIRPWLKAQAGLDSGQLLELAGALAAQPEREFAYTAIDLLKRHHRQLTPDSVHPIRELALIVPWWDTVDAYAGVLCQLGMRLPQCDPVIASWAGDAQLWARRLALIFLVGRKDRIDLQLLWAVCDANLADRDFFMRKGIGWALRDAARTYPQEVRAYVETNRAALSPLSIREALKHL